MPNTVRPRGIDSSGRAILASDFMWSVWERVCAELGFVPVITQGSWMARVPGGGAENSAGFHDGGGCFDLRTWDRTAAERDAMVRVLREYGCAAWRRYKSQGMDEDHLHFVLGTDAGLTQGARDQWNAYIRGRDGLANDGPDYELRPHPLVTKPPEEDDVDDATIEKIAKRTAELVLAAKPEGSTKGLGQIVKETLNKVKALK